MQLHGFECIPYMPLKETRCSLILELFKKKSVVFLSYLNNLSMWDVPLLQPWFKYVSFFLNSSLLLVSKDNMKINVFVTNFSVSASWCFCIHYTKFCEYFLKHFSMFFLWNVSVGRCISFFFFIDSLSLYNPAPLRWLYGWSLLCLVSAAHQFFHCG